MGCVLVGLLGPRVRQAARFGGDHFLEDRDQPGGVQVKRLIAAQGPGLRRHRCAGRIVGHVVERGDQLVACAGWR